MVLSPAGPKYNTANSARVVDSEQEAVYHNLIQPVKRFYFRAISHRVPFCLGAMLRTGGKLLLAGRPSLQITPSNHLGVRFYSRTSTRPEEEAAATKKTSREEKLHNKLAAREYNERNASYKRQVSLLRSSYAGEVAQQRAADKAEQEALERELTRRRLERQRQKNIRSAQNALRQQELCEQREKEFNEHLGLMQQQRDAKHERFSAARQFVIDELEEEAPLWLTSPEEVEARFTPEATQLLWARPGGVLGAPNPSIDSHFWQYETHTWHMNRTYKSQRAALLEELEEMAYEEANVDAKFWTPERVEEQVQLEEKARLRAMVHSTGRTELLKKQRAMLDEENTISEGEIPKPEAVPSMRVLNDDRALEKEGARLLMEDPTRFFLFDKDASVPGEEKSGEGKYSGPTLGSPIGLRDTLRETFITVFPEPVGKFPRPDTRTEREKKQEEREARLLAAAQAESKSAETDVEMAAEDRSLEEMGPDLDYDNMKLNNGDEEWEKGLDPVADRDIINTPYDRRYSEDDIDWVLERLKGNVEHFEQQFSQEMLSLQQKTKAALEMEAKQNDGEKSELEPTSLEAALLSLSDKELMALADLDQRFADGEKFTDEEFSEAAKDISGLTEDQLRVAMTRDRTI